MMKVVIDTNFIVYCAKQKIDFIEEIGRVLDSKFKIIVPSIVLAELQKLATTRKTKRTDREAAILALQIIDGNREQGIISIMEAKAETADGAILQNDERDTIIATLDRALRQRLKNAKILVIRQKRYLQLI